MTVIQALSEGLQVAGVGLIIVFSVLVILMLVLLAMKAIFSRPNKEQTKKADVQTTPVSGPVVADNTASDDTLIAVLTAAVAASLGTSVSRLKIKSFKRVDNNASAWNKAGINDVINSRF